MMTETELLQEAARTAGSDDFGGEEFRPALRVMLDAFEQEHRPHEVGARIISGWITSWLVERAWMTENLRRHPEIAEIPIQRPIVIVGLPRAGTTMLSRLMASDPANRGPVLWELYSPVDPPDMAPAAARDRAVTRAQALLDVLNERAPEVGHLMHPVNVNFPEEDDWLLRRSFLSPNLPFFCYIPSYFAWIENQSMLPAYQMWRKLLQFILWRNPGRNVGHNLVVKNPLHLFSLDSIATVAPDALVIMLHRDIREVIASASSLVRSLQTLTRPSPAPESVGAHVSTRIPRMVDRMLEYRSKPHSLEIMDIQYRTLIRDPLAVVRQIYERVGRAVDEPGADAMKGWLASNAQHKGGKHRHSLEQFNIDPEALSRRFQAYTDRFLEPDTGHR